MLDGPAPLDRILEAHTIAPFDDCGGHVNPRAGYHYHAVTPCLGSAAASSAHDAEVGVAMDGYRILTHELKDGTTPRDLDRCHGHDTTALGYQLPCRCSWLERHPRLPGR
ncbi:MAG: YHYH protein [Acidobacteria bacterium]|nr:YHYH protein [Acidobacteriota bacterium]